jgi:hypothetical protein
MDELVERLSRGRHPVELCLRPDNSIAVLSDCLRRGYVHVKFTDTRGGTEIGVSLDPAASLWSEDDLAARRGAIRLVGNLSLNYEKVVCTADIELSTLTGEGQLQPA